MNKYTLPSGKKLEVKPLPWEEAFTVFQDVSDTLANIEIKLPEGIDLMAEMKAGNIELILQFKTPLLKLLANKDISNAAKKCLGGKRCLVDGQKLELDYFEENRGDYMAACFYALQDNMLPFGEGLFSLF